MTTSANLSHFISCVSETETVASQWELWQSIVPSTSTLWRSPAAKNLGRRPHRGLAVNLCLCLLILHGVAWHGVSVCKL